MPPGAIDGPGRDRLRLHRRCAVVDDASAVAGKGGTTRCQWPIPGVGWLAYAKDTEGNIFGMMQNDPSAV